MQRKNGLGRKLQVCAWGATSLDVQGTHAPRWHSWVPCFPGAMLGRRRRICWYFWVALLVHDFAYFTDILFPRVTGGQMVGVGASKENAKYHIHKSDSGYTLVKIRTNPIPFYVHFICIMYLYTL